MNSPALWGTRGRIAELFETSAKLIACESRHFVMRYRSPEHWLEIFRGYYGPVLKAFAALQADGQRALADDIFALIARFNRAEDGTVAIYQGRQGGFWWFEPTREAKSNLTFEQLDEESKALVEQELNFESRGDAERFIAISLSVTTTSTSTTTTTTTTAPTTVPTTVAPPATAPPVAAPTTVATGA